MIYCVTMVMPVETHEFNAYHSSVSTTLVPCLVLLYVLFSTAQPKVMEEDISKAHIALV